MRSVPEWIGKSDDEEVPDRVKTRIFNRDKWQCQVCTRPLRYGDKPECDHVRAIINGGENRERNLWTLCKWCHAIKTKADVARKSMTYRSHRRRAGLRNKGRSFQTNKGGLFKKTFYRGTVRR